MAWALWLQYGLELEPCPLCVFQRIAVITTGVIFLIAAIHNPGRNGAAFYALLTVIASGTGAALAAWHVWIQAQPKGTVAACGMGLDYMLETMPLTDVISRVLKGSGECAEQGWLFLGLAITVVDVRVLHRDDRGVRRVDTAGLTKPIRSRG